MALPLPLNAVEHYMLADDSADYPRFFLLVLRLRERLDEPRLQRAIQAATERHPLLRANVQYDGNRPQQWTLCPWPQYPIHRRDGDLEPVRDGVWHAPPFDLHQEPGVRFHMRHDNAGDALYVEFHHACTDGLGAVQFLSDLLNLYETEMCGAEAALPALEAGRLASRDAFGLAGWRRPIRWLYGSLGWIASLEFLLHRPAPLGILPTAQTPSASGTSGLCSATLTARQSSALLQTAKRQRVTVNDLVIRDMFLALQVVIERHWPDRKRAHKRIMVPTNLRAIDDHLLPATNVVAMINLDRRPQRWTDPNRFLRVLHWELAVVKKLRLGVIFVQILHTLQALFGSLQRFLPRDRCQASCVVSNLGPVFAGIAPGLVRAVEFYPPIRPLTAVAFGVLTHNSCTTISLHYDASALTADQADELLEQAMLRLRAYERAEIELSVARVDRFATPDSSVEAGLPS